MSTVVVWVEVYFLISLAAGLLLAAGYWAILVTAGVLLAVVTLVALLLWRDWRSR